MGAAVSRHTVAGATEAGPGRARGGAYRVEETAANLTGDSKGAER